MMEKKGVYLAVVFSLLFLSGCAFNVANINNISKKKEYKTLDEVSIIGAYKDTKIQYRKGMILSVCQNRYKNISNSVMHVPNLTEELKRRNIHIKYIEGNSLPIKRQLVVKPVFFDCIGNSVNVEVSLYDMEEISQSWFKKEKKEIIKELTQLPENQLIYRKILTLNYFDVYKYKADKKIEDVTEELTPMIINELDSVLSLPPITRDLKTVQQEESLRWVNICEKQSKVFGLWVNKNKVLCVGTVGLEKATSKVAVKSLNILNASTGTTDYALENSSCRNLKVSFAQAEKNDTSAEFKYTFKKQVLSYYDNQCKVSQFDDINLMDCTKNGKHEYYIENSKVNDNRVYEKNLVQMDNVCFEQFKKTYQDKQKDKLWQTVHGANKFGWDSFGFNHITQSKYDIKGFDIQGWNKEGIHKSTGTKYNPDGFTVTGENKDGIDSDGWNPKLKKFVKVKKGKSNSTPSFVAREYKTRAVDELFNRDNYDKVSYIKEKDGFKLLAEKRNKNIIKKYYFKSKEGVLLDFDKPKESVIKPIELERTETVNIK